MFHSSRFHRFGSRLALAVFALNAFWPLVSLANPAGNQAWMAICSSTGMQQPAGNADPAQDGHSAIKIPLCPLCVVGGGMAMGTPPVTSPIALASTQEPHPLVSSLRAARPAAFAPALPRAPPYYS